MVLFVNERQKNNSLVKQSLENKSSTSIKVDCESDIYKKQEGKIAMALPEECKPKTPEVTIQPQQQEPQPSNTPEKSSPSQAYLSAMESLNSIPEPTVPKCYEPLRQVAIDKKTSALNYENYIHNNWSTSAPYDSSWYGNAKAQEDLRHENRLVEIEQQYLRDLAESNCT